MPVTLLITTFYLFFFKHQHKALDKFFCGLQLQIIHPVLNSQLSNNYFNFRFDS